MTTDPKALIDEARANAKRTHEYLCDPLPHDFDLYPNLDFSARYRIDVPALCDALEKALGEVNTLNERLAIEIAREMDASERAERLAATLTLFMLYAERSSKGRFLPELETAFANLEPGDLSDDSE